MDKRPDGHFRVCSCSSFGVGREEGELEGRSRRKQNEKELVEEEDGESGSEEEEEEEEDMEALSPTAVLPERWDVLGLGQAMVFLFFQPVVFYFKTFLLLVLDIYCFFLISGKRK